MDLSPTEEILAIRRELSARAGYDIHRIAEETRQRERESGRTYISLPPCSPEHVETPNPVTPQAVARASA